MPVIAHVVLRGVTREQYDAVRAAAGWLGNAPAGGLGHLTWWEGEDCHSVDAWESPEAFASFTDNRLVPAMAVAGVATTPDVEFHDAHEVFVPRAQTAAPTASEIGATDNVSVLRSGYAAFARGDIPAVLALFDETITWSTPDSVRYGGTYVGPAGAAEFFGHIPENYTEFAVDPLTFHADGDAVVVTGRLRGRTSTGNAVDVPFAHVWTFSNGRATTFTDFFDTAKVNAALALPAQRIDVTQQATATP